MNYSITKSITIFLALLSIAFTQEKKESFDERINIVFGLNQLLIDGFNIEVNYIYKDFIFDYSHGVSLDFPNDLLTGDLKDQQLEVHLPYTTGFGIGYRLNEAINIRVEPKWHRFEIYHMDDAPQSAAPYSNDRITAYTTFTLGLGLYGDYRPFKDSESIWKNLIIAPSIRYWPKLSSDLTNDKITYFNKHIRRTVSHKAMEVGIANTAWIVNISVGYSFNI